jgi:hypothetical protein
MGDAELHAFSAKQHHIGFAVSPLSLADFVSGNTRGYRPSGIYSIDRDRVIGVGDANLDISGNFASRALKHTLLRGKQYGCLANVDVLSGHQDKSVGSALAYHLLGLLPQHKKATVYAATNNIRLIQKRF